jgi:hypothetical protein
LGLCFARVVLGWETGTVEETKGASISFAVTVAEDLAKLDRFLGLLEMSTSDNVNFVICRLLGIIIVGIVGEVVAVVDRSHFLIVGVVVVNGEQVCDDNAVLVGTRDAIIANANFRGEMIIAAIFRASVP